MLLFSNMFIMTISTGMQALEFELWSFSLKITSDTAVLHCGVMLCQENNYLPFRTIFVTSHSRKSQKNKMRVLTILICNNDARYIFVLNW